VRAHRLLCTAARLIIRQSGYLSRYQSTSRHILKKYHAAYLRTQRPAQYICNGRPFSAITIIARFHCRYLPFFISYMPVYDFRYTFEIIMSKYMEDWTNAM